MSLKMRTCCFDGGSVLILFFGKRPPTRSVTGNFESYLSEQKKGYARVFLRRIRTGKLTLRLNSDILLTRGDLHILIDGRGV